MKRATDNAVFRVLEAWITQVDSAYARGLVVDVLLVNEQDFYLWARASGFARDGSDPVFRGTKLRPVAFIARDTAYALTDLK